MKNTLNPYIKNYFFVLSIVILILGLIAFSDNILFDVGQESNRDPVFIIHGLLMYAWILVLIIQTNYIRKLSIRAHIKFGYIGFVLAMLMIMSIIFLYATGPAFNEVPFFAKANRIFLPVAAIFILLAYLKRFKPELHKHFIFVGMFLILEPVLSRVGGNTGINPLIIAPVIWISLWISLFMYDFKSKRRIHPLTYMGLIFWLAVYIVVW